MAALLALAARITGLGAGALGVNPAVFALLAGLAIGALPTGYVCLLIGQSRGYASGYGAAGAQAQANTLARDLAEARLDASNARATAAAARADASRNAVAAARAKGKMDEYARLLARRGKAGACGLTDDDVRLLRGNGWAVQVRRGEPAAAGGR